MLKPVFVLTFLLAVSLNAQAPLVTDRPDFTESAIVIPIKSLQIESGLEWAVFDPNSVFTYPNTLLRFGLSDRFELRLEVPGWSKWESASAQFEDLGIGFKWQLTPGDAVVPAAILLHTVLPVGNETVRGEAGDFNFLYAGAYDFTDRLGLSWNLGVSLTEVDEKRQWGQRYSVALGIGLSERFACYLETMGEVDHNGHWAPLLDGGVTLALSAFSQLDAYIGFGLTEHAPDLVVGAGYSVRLFH